MGNKYAVGIDYGTESGRALLVNVATVEELATAVYQYAVYDQIYNEYRRLHDYFGRENDVMKRLKLIRAAVLST